MTSASVLERRKEDKQIIDWWKTAAVTFFTALSTLLIAWWSVQDKLVTQVTVSRMIQTESPYLEDRKSVREALALTQQSIQSISQGITDMRVQQAVLNSKLDAIWAEQYKSSKEKGKEK